MCKECSPTRKARVARMEVQAERLGDLQNFLTAAAVPVLPTVAVVAGLGAMAALTQMIESIHIPL